MITFALQIGYGGREAIAIRVGADSVGAVAYRRDFPLPGEIPIGSVEFCEEAFGPHRLDFYPDFLEPWMLRECFKSSGGITFNEPAFVKDATAWKSTFPSQVLPAGTTLEEGEWLISEVVRFVNEWRYYVANGSIITTGWYAGEDEDKPAPDIDVEWPDGFSGAVDFGELEDGTIALVEAHAPFACGWYGERHEDYARWQVEAWRNSSWWKSPLQVG